MTEYTGTTFIQPASERNLFEKTWFTPSTEDLAPGTPLREAIEQGLADWHPNHSDDNGRITGYDEWLERLEGSALVPERPDWYLNLGDQTDEDPWKTVLKIAKNLAKELR